ncbi:MAG: methyltransferase domain-containing protein [Caldilineaceae bacterium]
MAPAPTTREGWNQISAWYQRRHGIPTHSAHYGPWAPLENDLRLLGDVRGRRILEVGCGGGQCAIAFARQGATVAAMDLSDEQLAHARSLAAQEGVTIPFTQGSAEDLAAYASGAWDVVFSAYALQYVEPMAACLRECARVLRPGGRLVFSLDHPFRDCFFDAEADYDTTIYASRSYFDVAPMRWLFGDTGVPMTSYHRTIGEWVALLSNARFLLRRLLEPQPPDEMLDEIWPMDDALSALRFVPPTIIFVAEKA